MTRQIDSEETLDLVFAKVPALTPSQRRRIRNLQKECFSNVSREEIAECFIARSFGWVFAYVGRSLVGQIELYRRKVRFQDQELLLGGLGGTCVTGSARHKGVGSELVRKGIEILTQQGCDIACLAANTRDYPRGGLYRRMGFREMKWPISFDDVHGKIRYDKGELFAPICSKEVYELVMKSDETFHIGHGYW